MDFGSLILSNNASSAEFACNKQNVKYENKRNWQKTIMGLTHVLLCLQLLKKIMKIFHQESPVLRQKFTYLPPNVSYMHYYTITLFGLIYSVVDYDNIQGGSNMTGINCDLFTHKQSRSYLNHLVAW
jgi:hypothetical protein